MINYKLLINCGDEIMTNIRQKFSEIYFLEQFLIFMDLQEECRNTIMKYEEKK